jgi:hypothetical protein
VNQIRKRMQPPSVLLSRTLVSELEFYSHPNDRTVISRRPLPTPPPKPPASHSTRWVIPLVFTIVFAFSALATAFVMRSPVFSQLRQRILPRGYVVTKPMLSSPIPLTW